MTLQPIYDVLRVRLAVGQRVVFSMPGMFGFTPLYTGTVTALSPAIRVHVCAGNVDQAKWRTLPRAGSVRLLCVLRADTDREAWLRRQLSGIEG